MDRRDRIDSATAAVEVMQASLSDLYWPDHVPLAEADGPFWKSVIAEKPNAEWTDHDLEIAALLAMSMRKLQAEDARLEDEGSVTVSGGGSPMQNPRCRVVADLHARVIKYRQTLGIHNRGKNGEQRDVDKRRKTAFGIQADAPRDDDYLGMAH
jgi:hypothetical protein